MASVYVLLSEFPSANAVAAAHLTRLSNLLSESSRGRYGKDTAVIFREAARSSIGSHMPAKSLELKHTIRLIQELTIDIPTWRNVDPDISDMLFIMLQNIFVTGTSPLVHILKRNSLKENITMLLFPMPQRNLCV